MNEEQQQLLEHCRILRRILILGTTMIFMLMIYISDAGCGNQSINQLINHQKA